jgi:hypothetical protein
VVGVNIRIDYCSYGSCAVDFFEGLLQIGYHYVDNLEALKKKLENDAKVWLPKIERFEKWLKEYDIIADLGYLIFYRKGKIERIIGIHLYYSVWLKRPILRVADISEFTVEDEEDDP